MRPPSGPPKDHSKIEKTGKKDTIAGYTCEVWKITSKTNRAEACLAEKLKWIDFTDSAIESPSFAAIAAVSDFTHPPPRLVTFDDKNVEEGRMEVSKIDKKKLAEDKSAVPADFQVVELSALFARPRRPARRGRSWWSPGSSPRPAARVRAPDAAEATLIRVAGQLSSSSTRARRGTR